MIQLPSSPGQMILDDVAMRLRPLLPPRDFVKFCEKRNVSVSRELLHRLEELRVFNPVIRITGPDDEDLVLHFDGTPTAPEFAKDWIADTSAPNATYSVPDIDDSSSMAFYSEFQIWALEKVLHQTSRTFRVDEYAGADADDVDWNDRFRWLRGQASQSIERLCSDPSLASIPILCQVISNRYLPHALSNERTFLVGGTAHFSQWMQFSSHSWDWESYCDHWEPSALVSPFAIDESSLKGSYEAMVIAMRHCDPLWGWRELLQFVNQRRRDELKGDALRAESYRQGAHLLRLLYRDLYGEDLGAPQDIFSVIITHVPELAVREDPREYLQYVVNKYDLNPQPTAVLFVEGETEVVFVKAVFRRLFGAHHGVSGIEIMNLFGVDNATGRKRPDRYNAIFRLVDYLREHQTLAFIMLDNENQAMRLKQDASGKPSLSEVRSRAIPPGDIYVWERNFELDNFADDELASVLTQVAGGIAEFGPADIEVVRAGWPGARIATLYSERTGEDLRKPLMAELLVEVVVASRTQPDGSDRPVVDFLRRVDREAARNPLPIMKETWRENQEYLDSDSE